MNASKRRSGHTLIEAMITCSLFVLVFGTLALAVNSGIGLFRQSTANQEADARLDRAMHRIKQELADAATSSLAPNLSSPVGGPITWSNSLEYRQVTGWAGEAAVLGAVQRIELRIAPGEVANGLDDDGDGLVDERAVVLIRDFGIATEQEVTLVNDVLEFLEDETAAAGDENGNGLEDEQGLAFDLDGGTLNVRLTVGRTGPHGLVERTRVASIGLRN